VKEIVIIAEIATTIGQIARLHLEATEEPALPSATMLAVAADQGLRTEILDTNQRWMICLFRIASLMKSQKCRFWWWMKSIGELNKHRSIRANINREFISYVESVFSKRGMRCDVLLLSSRLSEDAVIRRQIVEGVLAVVRLTRINQATGKIPLRLFDRSAGAGNVKFEEYENLDAAVAAELVNRIKPAAPLPQTFSPVAPGAPYGAPPAYGQPASNPDLSALLGQFGSRPELQSLLSAMQPQGQAPQHASAPAVSQQLLAAFGSQQNSGYGQPAAQNLSSLASLLAQPQMAAVPNNGAQVQRGQGQQPDMAEIMAQLSKYQR
jgi:nuclear polyadenylated RNA-binding protein 3